MPYLRKGFTVCGACCSENCVFFKKVKGMYMNARQKDRGGFVQIILPNNVYWVWLSR